MIWALLGVLALLPAIGFMGYAMIVDPVICVALIFSVCLLGGLTALTYGLTVTP